MTLNHSSPAPLEDLSRTTVAEAERYTVGVDLGQSFDPTAISCIRKLEADDRDPSRSIFQVGHLERLPLGIPYPSIVRTVAGVLAAPRLRGKAELVIDYTGVGRPVFDMFEGAGLSPIGVTITSGTTTTNEGMIYGVPKLHLISRVQALLHSGRLKIHKGLTDAPALVAELQEFRAEVTDSGYWRFGARSGKHDDLVLAVAIALWRAHGDSMSGGGVFEYYRQLANGWTGGSPRTITPAEDVVLRAPRGSGTTTVHAMSGQIHTVDARGCVTVTVDDAEPLIRLGWQRVEQGPDALPIA